MNNLKKKPQFLTTFMERYSIASIIFMLIGNIFTYFNIMDFTLIYSHIFLILIIIFIAICVVRIKTYFLEIKEYEK